MFDYSWHVLTKSQNISHYVAEILAVYFWGLKLSHPWRTLHFLVHNYHNNDIGTPTPPTFREFRQSSPLCGRSSSKVFITWDIGFCKWQNFPVLYFREYEEAASATNATRGWNLLGIIPLFPFFLPHFFHNTGCIAEQYWRDSPRILPVLQANYLGRRK